MDAVEFLTSASSGFPVLAREHQADAHLVVKCGSDRRGQCSLWWRETSRIEGYRLGAIGHYEAADAASSGLLLEAALSVLRQAEVRRVVGPLDGNTWRRYRFITNWGAEKPFFLEPTNPTPYPAQWLAAGFTPFAEYFSGLCSDLTVVDPRLRRVEERLDEVKFRPLDASRFEEELEAIYSVSKASFTENFLYTPLGREDFMAQYLPLRDLIDPRLILLAEWNGESVGYVFGFPDLAQKQRGETVETAILKTVACLPGRRLAGLGALLVGKFHAAARELGYLRVIHALMHESNNSRNLSGIYTETMRRYTLFSRELI